MRNKQIFFFIDKALAVEIGRLIEQPEIGRELARQARRLVEETYDWSVVGQQAADAVLSGP